MDFECPLGLGEVLRLGRFEVNVSKKKSLKLV